MSEPEGTVVTTEEIYRELQQVSRVLIELKVRFEAIEPLERRVQKLEDGTRNSMFAWVAAAASTVAAVYGNIKH